jgi:hypothetical protein
MIVSLSNSNDTTIVSLCQENILFFFERNRGQLSVPICLPLKAFVYKSFLSMIGDGSVIKKEKIEEQEN